MSIHDSENLLESSLSQAFIPPPSRRQSALVSSQELPKDSGTPSAQVPTTPGDTLVEESRPNDDDWKGEYESQVESWRAQSAEAREKAEKERLRWEGIRAAEMAEAARNPQPLHASGEWEKVPQKTSSKVTSESSDSGTGLHPSTSSPSVADSRDLVAGEPEKHSSQPESSSRGNRSTNPPSQQDTGDESHKWEHVASSLTSSFPSMSFPETHTPSPEHNAAPVSTTPPSATLSIFDSSLSTRTRATALVSALAINLLLPFVNGVMLGFGEIFAKNVVLGWLGWKPATAPAAGTTGLGIRQTQRQTKAR